MQITLQAMRRQQVIQIMINLIIKRKIHETLLLMNCRTELSVRWLSLTTTESVLTDKEKSAMFEMGASDVIKKLLPIVDNFERGFKAITDEEKETPFAKGMDMVYKQTMKMLEDLEVKPIEAVGLEFNPDVHNAVMHVEDDSVGEGIVVEEFEKGYTYRDTVIRHSMVKVAN